MWVRPSAVRGLGVLGCGAPCPESPFRPRKWCRRAPCRGVVFEGVVFEAPCRSPSGAWLGPAQPRTAPVTIQRPERLRSHRVAIRTDIISAMVHHSAVSPPPSHGTSSATGAKTARVAIIAQAR